LGEGSVQTLRENIDKSWEKKLHRAENPLLKLGEEGGGKKDVRYLEVKILRSAA